MNFLSLINLSQLYVKLKQEMDSFKFNFATKQYVDENGGSGGTVDLSNYDTKAQVNAKDVVVLASAATAAASASKAASTITGTKTAAFISDFNTAVTALVQATIDGTLLVPLFVAIGESNIAGNALNSSATTDELAAHSEVQILNNTTLLFEPLDIGTNNIIDHYGFSPGDLNYTAGQAASVHGWYLELTNKVRANYLMSPQVYLIQSGQGGSTISQWVAGGTYSNKLIARIDAAKAILRAAGKVPLIYVFYSQGINDAIAGTSTATWKASTKAFQARIRAKLGFVPIVMTKFMTAYATYNTIIDEIVAEDDFTFAITTSDLSTLNANHWDYAGMKTLSDRVIDKFIEVGELQSYILKQNYILSTRSTIALTTPSAPTTPVTNDTTNTFGWTDTGGKTYANAEISLNSGASWVSANGNPHTGITGDYGIGVVQVRYVAVAGVSNASPSLSNTTAFTITNLLNSPTDFANTTNWVRTAIQGVTANATTDQAGATTADLMIPNTTATYHFLTQTITKPASVKTYDFVIYVKASGITQLGIDIGNAALSSADLFQYFVLSGSLGATVASSGGWTLNSKSIVADANGYYKITMNFTTDTGTSISIYLNANNGSGSFASDGTSGIYLANASLVEQ